ncbi:hypothetical protein [Nitrosomonas sp.]|uniref:hypothetical protein n=1 Tax=Nitrosomonas sp. TaxID=42353 RepID=UPI0025F3902B|nr:hypothetical protein [Nitrosomonas sp.]
MTDFVTENTTPANAPAKEPVEQKDPAKEYRAKLVQKLVENVKRESEFMRKFHELFGDYPGLNSDTCLYRFVNDLLADQISIVATLIGDTKVGLDWFLFENECGDKGYEAGIDEGETRPIKTVEDYLWLVDVSKEI